MGQVIAISNQKGGVGKSTTTVMLATLLTRLAKMSVLVIDADSQGNSSMNLGLNPEALDEVHQTLAFALVGEVLLEEVIQGENPAAIASWESSDAVIIEDPLVLKKGLNSVRDNYDFILIDCAPTLTRLTAAALTAADFVLIPSDLSIESAQGLGRLLRTITTVRERSNPSLKILGVLPTRFRKAYSHDQEVLAELKANLEPEIHVFEPIMDTTEVQKAARAGAILVDFNKHSRSVKQYIELAAYILKYV